MPVLEAVDHGHMLVLEGKRKHRGDQGAPRCHPWVFIAGVMKTHFFARNFVDIDILCADVSVKQCLLPKLCQPRHQPAVAGTASTQSRFVDSHILTAAIILKSTFAFPGGAAAAQLFDHSEYPLIVQVISRYLVRSRCCCRHG